MVVESLYRALMALEQDIETLALFTEPQRLRLFEQVQARRTSTVNELAAGLGIGRSLVTFHLGKLIEAGFVEVAPPERPAAARGRPSVRYRITGRETVVSFPHRRYDLLAGVLLDGVADHLPGESAHTSALRAARRRGRTLGHGFRDRRPVRTNAGRFARLERLLSALGYAPHRRTDELLVRNCPFDKFRPTNTAEVCSLNQALSEGYLEGLGLDEHLRTELRPCPGACCLVYRPLNA